MLHIYGTRLYIHIQRVTLRQDVQQDCCQLIVEHQL